MNNFLLVKLVSDKVVKKSKFNSKWKIPKPQLCSIHAAVNMTPASLCQVLVHSKHRVTKAEKGKALNTQILEY